MTLRNSLLPILSLITGMLPLHLGAQPFAARAPLGAVSKTGFYQIPVTPELTAQAKSDLSDLRILDAGGAQVPYILRQSRPPVPGASFREFPVLDITTTDSLTVVTLACPDSSGIDGLSLILGNTAVSRYTSLSGSNDRQQWFILDEHILLGRAAESSGDRYVQSVHFPLSKYRYFRLAINNAGTDPLHILKAGIYTSGGGAVSAESIPNPAPAFTQKDSSGTSYLTIVNKAPFLADRITLGVSGPPFYKRTVTIYAETPARDNTYVTSGIGSFTLSSDHPPTFSFYPVKWDRMHLEIENGDSPPLRITRVQTAQAKQYIVAWLEVGKAYSLAAGSPGARAPQYDLAHFNDSIPAALNTLDYGTFTTTSAPAAAAPDNRNYWLWPVIILVIAVLGFLTYRLVGDMKGKGI